VSSWVEKKWKRGKERNNGKTRLAMINENNEKEHGSDGRWKNIWYTSMENLIVLKGVVKLYGNGYIKMVILKWLYGNGYTKMLIKIKMGIKQFVNLKLYPIDIKMVV
jgi:hypothetical protein